MEILSFTGINPTVSTLQYYVLLLTLPFIHLKRNAFWYNIFHCFPTSPGTSFTEKVAEDVMLCAHNHGFAVAGEYGKEIAIEHAKKLVEKGLIAEAKESDEPSGDSS